LSLLLAPLGAFAIAASAAATVGDTDASAREQKIHAFVAQARAATEKYHDRTAAIADGYRLIGEDFPGMGEHWINIELVFDGRYDVTHPEFLTYIDLDGVPRLLGVAYALPLLEGEEPPDEPAGRGAWHAHTRGLDDETLVPRHHEADHGRGGPRLAMLHAWIWLDNPEGLFAADNWAIPFFRLGLTPPRAGGAQAGKALSLLSGADGYLARAVATAVAPAAIEPETLGAAIARARESTRAIVRARAGPSLSDTELAGLAAVWQEMWYTIDAKLSDDAGERLRPLAFR
jgi:hypothetical protein